MISDRFRFDFGPVSRHERAVLAIPASVLPGFVTGEATMTKTETAWLQRALCATWAVDPTTGRPAACWAVGAAPDQDVCLQASRIELHSSPARSEAEASNQKGRSLDVISGLLITIGATAGCWIFWQSPYADYRPADYAGCIFRATTGLLVGLVIAGLVVMPIREAIKRRSRA
jgi:hypothetical protein